MISTIATFIYALGVLGLFVLDRDLTVRTSKALWIPVIWVLIAGSRPVSAWLGFGPTVTMQNADQYLDGSPLDRYVFSALLLAGLIILFGRRVQLRRLLQRNPAIILFFTYCAISVLWSDYSAVSFKRWVKAVSDLVMVL